MEKAVSKCRKTATPWTTPWTQSQGNLFFQGKGQEPTSSVQCSEASNFILRDDSVCMLNTTSTKPSNDHLFTQNSTSAHSRFALPSTCNSFFVPHISFSLPPFHCFPSDFSLTLACLEKSPISRLSRQSGNLVSSQTSPPEISCPHTRCFNRDCNRRGTLETAHPKIVTGAGSSRVRQMPRHNHKDKIHA